MDSNKYNELLKVKLIEVFDYTIQFIESHNLKWYVCGGTAIGAVRHKDIIPWDDDIDIFMPRADYDRLLEIRNEMDESSYKLYSFYDKGYYHPYYKVVDMKTTILEERTKPFVLGAYVDIFPLEDTDITPEDYKTIHEKCAGILSKFHRSVSVPSLCVFVDMLVHFHIRSCINIMENAIYYRWKWKSYLNEYIRAYNEYYNPKGNCYTHPYGYCGPYKEIYKKEWFKDVIKSPFNRLTVNIPIGYDEYLTQVFGDYMTPPPVEKRRDTHGESRYYINLHERLSIPEIEKRVAKGFNRE